MSLGNPLITNIRTCCRHFLHVCFLSSYNVEVELHDVSIFIPSLLCLLSLHGISQINKTRYLWDKQIPTIPNLFGKLFVGQFMCLMLTSFKKSILHQEIFGKLSVSLLELRRTL